MKDMENKEDEDKKKEVFEAWKIERCRELLVSSGKILDFDVSDIVGDGLREIVENVRHSQRMREPDFAEFRERF